MYDGTNTATVDFAAVHGGVELGDNVTSTAPATRPFDDKNVGTGKTVTVTGVALTGADAGNYTVSEPTGDAPTSRREPDGSARSPTTRSTTATTPRP